MIEWEKIQSSASAILAEGIFMLKNAPIQLPQQVSAVHPCNYIISLNNVVHYIGEGGSAGSRIKVQFDERRSTFYKNYLKTKPEITQSITAFDLRLIRTNIGRKEIEDFGIVNFPAPLNRFQLGKRLLHQPATSHAQWDAVQTGSTVLLKQGAARCMESGFSIWSDAAAPLVCGIYLIKNGVGEVIYVGESSDIGTRYQTHCHRTYFSAVRRNLGQQLLGYELQERNGKKRYFEPHEDEEISAFLDRCSVAFIPVNFGRYEVEEFLIKKLKPILNRKSKG